MKTTAELSQPCEMCGATAVREIVNHSFDYGHGNAKVTLRTLMPVWQCATCDLEYTDSEGEAARHEAICRHLGRVSPSEASSIRALSGLSQKAFASELDVGIASVKRWELGTVIPNRSLSQTLRAYRARLMEQRSFEPVFRTEITPAMHAASEKFVLRGWTSDRETT
jgi:YgiT-type zinc finger domain-containing protein